jgi:Tfp pilus assembly protein PilF
MYMKRFLIIVLFLIVGCATTPVTPPVDKSKIAEGYYLKGMNLFEANNYELASVEFNRSVQTDSNYKKSYYMLGLISDYRDKLDDAVSYYKEAISCDSQYSDAYNALGTVYSRQQKWNDALKAFQKALDNKLYPTPHIPYLNMGRLYMAQKKYDKAVEAYRESKRYANQDFIIYELGTALFDAGETRDAIKEFREGVAMVPQNANMRYSLAVALLKDGNKNGAIEEFKKASELAPGSEIAKKSKEYIHTLR